MQPNNQRVLTTSYATFTYTKRSNKTQAEVLVVHLKRRIFLFTSLYDF